MNDEQKIRVLREALQLCVIELTNVEHKVDKLQRFPIRTALIKARNALRDTDIQPIVSAQQRRDAMMRGREIVEASDMGFAPGDWPHSFSTSLGNGNPMILYARLEDGAHKYVQQLGNLRVTILND